MRYACEGFDPADASNIMHAARIFANRMAHQKYGTKGRCRTLVLRNHKGARGASFEAFIGIFPPYGDGIGETYSFAVVIEPGNGD